MFEKVTESYVIKGKTIKNRFTVPAMVTNYCTNDGKATEQYIAYHEAKAKGGWGLIITEDYAVDPSGKGYVNVAGLWNDEQIESHRELPRRVHQYGSVILAQIYHCGRQTNSRITGMQPVAPSAVNCPINQEIPRELTVTEIKELIKKFGDTAERAKKCGFDGVEIHGGHGYLIAEFMSPYTNKRIDAYGGSLQNRLRFPVEIIKEIRERCGEDFIIDFRISGDEKIEGGRTIEDTRAIARVLEQAGLDMIHISCGTYGALNSIIPTSVTAHGWIVEYAAEVKKVVEIPVITVGRINDPMLADSILKAGKADFVAMGRASLADPELPNKTAEGRYGEIRRCIGCNKGCSGQLNMQKTVKCAINPELGREYEGGVKPAEAKKKVAVIGAGPAGLQAAVTAKEAGHDVTIYEKQNAAGGQFRIAAIPPFKGEITDYLNRQLGECKRLGIEIKYNTAATAELMKEAAPDVIIYAAGAVPVTPKMPGVDGPNVVYANDVLEGKSPVSGMNVAVIGGGQVGAETAHHLAVQLKQVTLVEMLPAIMGGNLAEILAMTPLLLQRGVRIMTGTAVREIREREVLVNNGQDISIPADTVVLAVGSRSDTKLKDELAAAGFDVRTIGDAGSVRDVLCANMEAYDTARNL